MNKTGHKTMMAFLAGLGCDVHAPAMTAATPMHLRPTREEEERAARARCDRQDALDAAEEKRKRKNAKRLADAKKVGAGRTAHNAELTGAQRPDFPKEDVR